MQQIFQTCFFLLLIVEHNLKKRGEPWPGIKESLQRFAQTGSDQPPFLANKTAQVLALAFVDLYPTKWPDFFQSLIQSGPDIFLRTLSQIDGEVVNRQINHSKVKKAIVSTKHLFHLRITRVTIHFRVIWIEIQN